MSKLPALFCLVGGATTVAAASSPFFITTTVGSPLTRAGDTLDPGGATAPFGPEYVLACLDPASFASAEYPDAFAPAWPPSSCWSCWAAYCDCIRDPLVVNACKSADPTNLKNFTPYQAANIAVEDGHVPPLEMANATCLAITFGGTTPCHSTRPRQTPVKPPERNLSLAFHGDDDLLPVHLPVCHHVHELIKLIPNRGEGVDPIVVVVVIHMFSSIKKSATNIDGDEAETLSATNSARWSRPPPAWARPRSPPGRVRPPPS